jgi:hypothetical protein
MKHSKRHLYRFYDTVSANAAPHDEVLQQYRACSVIVLYVEEQLLRDRRELNHLVLVGTNPCCRVLVSAVRRPVRRPLVV